MEEYAYFTIHFLTPAEDFEDAISRVEDNLEYKQDFYDDYEVLRNDSGSLDDKMEDLAKIPNLKDSISQAEEYLLKAEASKRESDFTTAGYLYRRAGMLYEGALTDDRPIYNIASRDYQIPFNARGWFSIAVQFNP